MRRSAARRRRPRAARRVHYVFVRLNWDRTALPLVLPGHRLHVLNIGPEPGYPFGRKGLALLAAWQRLGPAAVGMLTVDGDVMIDPYDLAVMLEAFASSPDDVHTAPVKLWPTSTQRAAWTWGHYRDAPSQDLDRCESPHYFCFGFTFLPRRLLEACDRAGLERWAFPSCDTRVSEVARRLQIPVHVVRDAQPKHVPVSGF